MNTQNQEVVETGGETNYNKSSVTEVVEKDETKSVVSDSIQKLQLDNSLKTQKEEMIKEKELNMREKEKNIKNEKEEIQKTQEEYNKYQQKTEKVRKELEEAKKIYEAMLAAGMKGKSN
jgi:hypothetical protein